MNKKKQAIDRVMRRGKIIKKVLMKKIVPEVATIVLPGLFTELKKQFYK